MMRPPDAKFVLARRPATFELGARVRLHDAWLLFQPACQSLLDRGLVQLEFLEQLAIEVIARRLCRAFEPADPNQVVMRSEKSLGFDGQETKINASGILALELTQLRQWTN